ncbi:MAG TPA: UDP-2,3-diacylglucosamine diphosphatase [Methylibium sp.]|nr:UDP-2,3-diacylglucosamine diphosphatase [Methylibium sp.]
MDRAAARPALPQFWEFVAPQAWRSIDFIADLHLQAFRPRTVAAFADHLRHTPADAVFILGDLFEAWVGDDARHSGFESEVADILQDAASYRCIAFMPGNRDFLLGTEMLRDCGILALADPTVLVACGERLLLTHGDALCLDDEAYQRFRTEVRADAWRHAFLARPLEQRRALAAQMRDASMQHQRAQAQEHWADVDEATAARWMHEAGTPVLVHGHTHRPGNQPIAPGLLRMVLSDWEFDMGAPRADVLRLSRFGLERVAPARAG